MKLDGLLGILPNSCPTGAENHCDRALVGIARVCTDVAGKGAVFASERSVSLRNGVLDYKIDFKSFDDGITVLEYLQNNL